MMKGAARNLQRLSLARASTTRRLVASTALKSLVTTSGRAFSTAAPAFNPKTDPSLLKQSFRERLARERQASLMGGGQARIDKIHARGSLTARERLELLFDPGSFNEVDQLKAHRCTQFGMESKSFPGDGIVTGKLCRPIHPLPLLSHSCSYSHTSFWTFSSTLHRIRSNSRAYGLRLFPRLYGKDTFWLSFAFA